MAIHSGRAIRLQVRRRAQESSPTFKIRPPTRPRPIGTADRRRWTLPQSTSTRASRLPLLPPAGPRFPLKAPGRNRATSIRPRPPRALHQEGSTGFRIDFAMWGILPRVGVPLPVPLDRQGPDVADGRRRDLSGVAVFQRLHDRLLPGDGPDRAAHAGAGAGAFVAFARRHRALAAVLAGAASAFGSPASRCGFALAAGLVELAAAPARDLALASRHPSRHRRRLGPGWH